MQRAPIPSAASHAPATPATQAPACSAWTRTSASLAAMIAIATPAVSTRPGCGIARARRDLLGTAQTALT